MPNQTEASARIDLKLPLERLLVFGGARAVFLISTSQELACAFTPSQAGELLNGVAARNKVARLGKLALIGPGLGLEGASGRWQKFLTYSNHQRLPQIRPLKRLRHRHIEILDEPQNSIPQI